MRDEEQWMLVEEVDVEFEIHKTYKMKVKGGAIYLVEREVPLGEHSRQFAISTVFVPDPPQQDTRKRVKVRCG